MLDGTAPWRGGLASDGEQRGPCIGAWRPAPYTPSPLETEMTDRQPPFERSSGALSRGLRTLLRFWWLTVPFGILGAASGVSPKRTVSPIQVSGG